MQYQRKLSSQQEGIQGEDPQYGALKMVAKAKIVSHLIIAITAFLFALGIYWNIELKNFASASIASIVLIVFFLGISIFYLSFLFDRIAFYEYGLIQTQCFGFYKRKLAYDDIEAVMEKQHWFFGKISKPVPMLWRIDPKPSSKAKKMVIDATAYRGISQMMITLCHDAKIENHIIK